VVTIAIGSLNIYLGVSVGLGTIGVSCRQLQAPSQLVESANFIEVAITYLPRFLP
jgi:hypothetical protein